LPYRDLWGERSLVSVADLTRQDASALMSRVGVMGITIQTTTSPLAQANAALADRRAGRFHGAAVLIA